MASETKSWTDDLPKCILTAVGSAENCAYRSGIDQHKCWDRSFSCRVDENCFLYAIFSGHNGATVAEMAMQRIAAEILLGQLNGKTSEEDIKDVLRQAVISVEKFYQETVDGLLARKTMLHSQLAEKPNHREDILKTLRSIHVELSTGCSAALCLIHQSKLYVCNVGTCRVLVCKNDENKAPRFIQFSVDHNLMNEDEILRLRQIGLDIQKLRQFPIYSTRCLGYYLGKTGYKDCELFAGALCEPVIAQPEIVGGIPIDDSFQFLLLMSSGMCKTLQDIFAGDTVKEDKEIVRITAKAFETQKNLIDIAQYVVTKLINSHQELYNASSNSSFGRDDITLILRNFNTPLSSNSKKANQVTFNSVVQQMPSVEDSTLGDTIQTSINDTNQYTDTETTVSSFDHKPSEIFDTNRKIAPYVDFKSFFENVQKARKEGTLPPGIDFD